MHLTCSRVLRGLAEGQPIAPPPERIEACRRELSSALRLTASMQVIRAHQRRRHVTVEVTRRTRRGD